LETLEDLDQWDPLEHQDLLEDQDRKDQLVIRVPLDQLDLLVQQVRLVSLERWGIKDLPVALVEQDQLEHLV